MREDVNAVPRKPSHEDRLTALEEQLNDLTVRHNQLGNYVTAVVDAIGRNVGIPMPKEP